MREHLAGELPAIMRMEHMHFLRHRGLYIGPLASILSHEGLAAKMKMPTDFATAAVMLTGCSGWHHCLAALRSKLCWIKMSRDAQGMHLNLQSYMHISLVTYQPGDISIRWAFRCQRFFLRKTVVTVG